MKDVFKFPPFDALVARTASAAIGASTARNMGPKGTIQQARKFLYGLNIHSFVTNSEAEFQKKLNDATLEFKDELPEGARYWGSCRKFLNIYLRDVAYNQYLDKEFGLSRIIHWLEVPLDSHVAKGLRLELGGNALPRWNAVIHLSEDVSRTYQDFAKKVALRLGTEVVHLDVLYWRHNSLDE